MIKKPITFGFAWLVIFLCSAGSSAKPIHHYVFFGMDREKIKDTRSFLENEMFEGAQIAYLWSQLENEEDKYNFGLIREDLAFLTEHHKKLWIQIQDITFSEKYVPVPRFLRQDPQYNGGADRQYQFNNDDEEQPIPSGWAARRWDPAVQERFHKLLFALGKEFDGRIEGVNFAETSVTFGQTGKLFPKGYTPEIYREAIIANLKALKRAFPKSIAMQYANFMPGGQKDLERVYQAARESRVAVGGPDLLPFRPFQMANSYPLIKDSAGIIPSGIAVQDGNYADVNRKTGQRASIEMLINFATDFLKVDYIFWCTEEPYFSNELVPFVKHL